MPIARQIDSHVYDFMSPSMLKQASLAEPITGMGEQQRHFFLLWEWQELNPCPPSQSGWTVLSPQPTTLKGSVTKHVHNIISTDDVEVSEADAVAMQKQRVQESRAKGAATIQLQRKAALARAAGAQ